ncbi:hypothetical protein [Nocardia sp. NPDC057455]
MLVRTSSKHKTQKPDRQDAERTIGVLARRRTAFHAGANDGEFERSN